MSDKTIYNISFKDVDNKIFNIVDVKKRPENTILRPNITYIIFNYIQWEIYNTINSFSTVVQNQGKKV